MAHQRFQIGLESALVHDPFMKEVDKLLVRVRAVKQ